jgi:LemA protein
MSIGEEMREQNGTKSYLLIAVSVIIIGILGWFVLSYNSLVAKEEQVKTAWSQVERNLQRKVDLLPNLVKVVKRYAAHEKEVFEKIAALRSDALHALQQSQGKADEAHIKAIEKIEQKLDTSVLKLFAVAENYPQLRASEQFMQLQSQIEGAENRINITRMQFNEAVGAFNHYMRTIPANIVASIAGFQRKAYFKAQEKAHKPVKLEI